LVRYAHPPAAENDGIVEFWNIGSSLRRIEKNYDPRDKPINCKILETLNYIMEDIKCLKKKEPS